MITLLAPLVVVSSVLPQGPEIVPPFLGELAIETISAPGGIDGAVTQMAWGPPGPAGVERLFVATLNAGILRFDYNPSGVLTNRQEVAPDLALGIAFDQVPALQGQGGAVLYFSRWAGATNAVLTRLTDTNGDGLWGASGDVRQDLVNDIPLGSNPYGHHMNQIQILGDSLFVGIGVGSDLGDNENAFTGTLCWIENLRLLDGNAATPNLASLAITNFDTDPTPFTSTAANKLRVHSSGVRNAFGLAIDGDEHLWLTVNQIDVPRPGTGETTVPQDQLFRAFEKADYAYRDGLGFPQRNAVHDFRTDPAVLAAGFFDPQKQARSLTADLPDPDYQAAAPGASSGLPHGLGPHSSADGFDFCDGNAFALRWHKDAFVARQSEQIAAPLGPFEDLATVDLDTGEVLRVAKGFTACLDVLADSQGHLLVGEVGFGRGIYRVRPKTPVAGAHPFAWALAEDGNWWERRNWNVDENGDGLIDPVQSNRRRKVPHAWGNLRYDVTIDVEDPLTVTLDRDAVIEKLTLANRLFVDAVATLTVADDLTMERGAVLAGHGRIAGDLNQLGGSIKPGGCAVVPFNTKLAVPCKPVGTLRIDGDARLLGELSIDLARPTAGAYDRVEVAGDVVLRGSLSVDLLNGFQPKKGQAFDILVGRTIDDRGFRTTRPWTAAVARLPGGRQALRVQLFDHVASSRGAQPSAK